MARTREKPKLEYKISPQECFVCLASMPQWAAILSERNSMKKYNWFLLHIIEHNFYNDNSTISISRIAKAAGISATQANKWLKSVYEDILELNSSDPELFCRKGELVVNLMCTYFDTSINFTMSVPVLPRKTELFEFYFIKAAIGTHYFYVKEVYYDVQNDKTDIYILLDGQIYSQYRDFALSKALFEGTITNIDIINLVDAQINRILLNGKNL